MNSGKIREVCLVFLKLGFIGFGGPAAHIALMEEEVVNKRKWMTHEHFLDLIGATNLIPGPNSTEMTMHCGHERAGVPGLFLAGICFIFPAALITTLFAWLYAQYGSLPAVEPFLYGIKPAIIAIVLNAIYKLGQKALKNWQLGVIGLAVVVVTLLGVNEIYALLGAGILVILLVEGKGLLTNKKLSFFAPLVFLAVPTTVSPSYGRLFFTFLKIGATLFGSGYVLVAYLQAEFIDKLHWLTQQQLIDAIAVGQFTPGPLFSTATFIGYQVGGLWGAVVATVGIFLPAFFFVLLLNPYVSKLRKSKVMGAFLDGVNIGAVGVMITATMQLSANVLIDWKTLVIGLISLLLIFIWKKLNATWIVLGSALAGYLLAFIN